MEQSFDEIMDVLDKKYFLSERTGYTLPHGIYEVSNINRTLEYFLPDIVKVSNTIDFTRLRSM